MAYIKIEPFADGVIKSTTMSSHITPPVPEWVDGPWGRARVVKNMKPTDHEECMRKSVSRTKNKIFAYAHNMNPEWFGTLTLAPDKVKDRYDMDVCRRAVSKWLENLRMRKCPLMMYLVVPERHKDGAWHFHVLLSNVSALHFKDSGHKYNGMPIYNLLEWRKGFSNFTRVQDVQKTATYMVKYITKDLACDVSGRQRYLVSKNIPTFDAIVVDTMSFSAEEVIADMNGWDVETMYEKQFALGEKLGLKDDVNVRIAYHRKECK